MDDRKLKYLIKDLDIYVSNTFLYGSAKENRKTSLIYQQNQKNIQ